MNIVRIPSFTPPEWKYFTRVGSATVGTGLLVHQTSSNHHNSLQRSQSRSESLNMKRLTPQQYVILSAQDGKSGTEVKEELVAYGGTHKGLDYSDPNSFKVEDVFTPSENPVKRILQIQDRSLCLVEYGKKKEELVLGRRGGGTTSAESEAVIEETLVEDGPEMGAGGYRYSPNISYEISEQLLEEPRPVAHSFTATVPYRTPDFVFYGVAILVTVAGSFLFEYVKHRFPKWTDSKDSQQSDPEGLEEIVLAKETTKVQGDEKGLKTVGGPAKQGTPEVLLETLKSCRRRVISKKEAVYILDTYYGLSEEKALELLG